METARAPKGFMLVPIEASEQMMEAGLEAALCKEPSMDGRVGYRQIRAAYDAMLFAASVGERK